MSLLGLDVGTTGCKAVAFSLDGHAIASAYGEYPLYSPQPGWQELDPEEVWACVKRVLTEVGAATGSDPITAMAISAQGEACHPIDKNGECLMRSIVSFDDRTATAPEFWLERKSAYELASVTGMPIHGMYSINKIMWIKEHQPEIFDKASKFLCYEDYVQFRLGLEPVISHSLAARTMALDVKAGDWSDEILKVAGLTRDILSPTAPSGQPVGEIPNSVALELGLPKGIIVVTGGHDQPAGALGAGILEGGEALYATGTVDCICPVFDTFSPTPETVAGNLCAYPCCIPDRYCSIAFNFTGGALLKWYRDQFGATELEKARQSGADVYDIICSNIPEKPENVIILPHFTVTGTPYFDTESRGVIAGLTLNTTREEIASAILSGVTYEMKLNLELLETSGQSVKRLRASGGGSKSPVWVQRKADILQRPIAVLGTSEAPCAGMAMLAAQGTGLARSLEELVDSFVEVKEVYEPSSKGVAAYEERYEIYRELYPAMKAANQRIARLGDSE